MKKKGGGIPVLKYEFIDIYGIKNINNKEKKQG
jgi:hypothetical protein